MIPDGLKDFLLHKLTLRILYIAAAFSTSHLIAFASSEKVRAFLYNAGVSLTVVDPVKLKTYITGSLLIGGEFVFHYFHNKMILPHVVPEVKP